MTDGDAELELDWKTIMSLIDAGITRTVFWQVSELLDNIALSDEEIDALLKMPASYRQRMTAAFIEYAETLREGSRSLDGQIMRLTGELV